MSDIVERLRAQGADAFAKHYSLGMWKLCAEAADEIERLANCHRIVARQAGFYKPELPDHTTVEVHLGTLRAAANCATERT